ncbi:S-layer homology domain-containing protein [Paenibacillus agricola]|uniref:S-layer homology domain-containing protein n=1 Tax=Paenibacillus agricola TaxID=2716264 RepID=A0ABX0JDL6_9BACL|nr:S-layer homology domain-containing protein [Paenibacillus agricola]NHN33349.1 S-layer homology domain-containing protein [Paenibacillus agricola]
MKKITKVALSISLLSGILMSTLEQQSNANGENILTDITQHWAESTIKAAIQKGYVDGYEDSSFKPDANITRAEFVKMLSVATDKVADITGGVWYGKYVDGLTKLNIVRDKEFDSYTKPITRLEMAKVSLRAIRPDLQDVSYNDYSDKEYIFDAVSRGLIQGLDKGDLNLEGVTTRAQAVTIIERVLTAAKNGKLEVDYRAMQTAEVSLRNTNAFTMFGYKTIGFPFTLPLTDMLKATVNSVIIIDGDDVNSPYYDVLDGLVYGPTEIKTAKGQYAFVYNMDLEISPNLVNSIVLGDHFDMLKGFQAHTKNSLYGMTKNMAGTTINTNLTFMLEKERIDVMVKEDNLIAMLIVNGKSLDYFVKKTR